jgi:hypothetical protein
MKFYLKKIALVLTLSFLIFTGFAQTTPNSKFSKDYYLKKSKSKRTTAWFLLGGGTVMMVAGAIAFSDNWDKNSYTATDVSGFILLSGLAADIVSIPFFASAHNNKKRAASIAIINQKKFIPFRNNSWLIVQPSVAIRIGL